MQGAEALKILARENQELLMATPGFLESLGMNAEFTAVHEAMGFVRDNDIDLSELELAVLHDTGYYPNRYTRYAGTMPALATVRSFLCMAEKAAKGGRASQKEIDDIIFRTGGRKALEALSWLRVRDDIIQPFYPGDDELVSLLRNQTFWLNAMTESEAMEQGRKMLAMFPDLAAYVPGNDDEQEINTDLPGPN